MPAAAAGVLRRVPDRPGSGSLRGANTRIDARHGTAIAGGAYRQTSAELLRLRLILLRASTGAAHRRAERACHPGVAQRLAAGLARLLQLRRARGADDVVVQHAPVTGGAA